jgi:hypothetical protein
MKFLGLRSHLSAIGIDIHIPYLMKCRTKRSHEGCLLCDARRLPFRKKSFDQFRHKLRIVGSRVDIQ